MIFFVKILKFGNWLRQFLPKQLLTSCDDHSTAKFADRLLHIRRNLL